MVLFGVEMIPSEPHCPNPSNHYLCQEVLKGI